MSFRCFEHANYTTVAMVSRNIGISAVHIAGKSNHQADLESRQNKTETEWAFNRNSLSYALAQLNFPPEIDLFASRFTHAVHPLCRIQAWPRYGCHSCFSLDWSTLNFDALPPYSVNPAVLKKIRDDKGTGVCVLPNWPTQAWFPLAMRIAICEKYTFGQTNFSCTSPASLLRSRY